MNKEAYKLFHAGTLALSTIEGNGIRVNVNYCKDQQKEINNKIQALERHLYKTPVVKAWMEMYGDKFNLDSNTQLGKVLFQHLKMDAPKLTPKGNPSVDKETLHLIKNPIVKPLIQLRQLKKLSNTYLKNIIDLTIDEFLHPSFNLHTVRTFRSSSDRPNFQNMPIRDKEMGKIIRQAFIPRKNHLIGGIDYAAIEVRIAACYHKDTNMLSYIKDPQKDMHRDMAMQCYNLTQDEVSKDVRYCAKNQFVFPQFYGSWYEPCAEALFNSISKMKLTTVSGTSLKKHLGMSYKKFSNHIKTVEDDFWNHRFKEYRDWKKTWIRQYHEKGCCEMLTGFICSGPMGDNNIINYPVQGVAFHCLLWSLIKLNAWLIKNKMKSMIIGQIHDEITLDCHKDELTNVLEKAKEIMTEDIKKWATWLIVPLEIEAEFSDKNWFEKEEIKIQ